VDQESIFRLLFILGFVATVAVRLYYHRKAETFRGNGLLQSEGKLLAVTRLLLALPWLVVILIYMIYPQALAWAALPLPLAWRWFGVGLGIFGLGLLVWVHRALSTNFSTTLRIREDHTLVTSGPYHWVRHPMYTVFILAVIGQALQTANWLFGLTGAMALGLVLAVRTPKEEAQLIAKFGDEYRQYMQRTGRFLPRLLS
jgi:protein-S-isoprenylcysteine O-methyltransferase Ste14